MKLLSAKYKTQEGAMRRTANENALAPFEFENGYKARRYRYRTEQHEGMWRVARYIPNESSLSPRKES